MYSRTPLIRTLITRIGLAVQVNIFLLYLYCIFYGLKFTRNCPIHMRNYVLIFYLYLNKYVA